MTATSQILDRPGFQSTALVVSIDGGQRNGIAVWDQAGILIDKAILSFDELDDWLDAEDRITVIVLEDYVTDHRAARLKGSKNAASQTNGMVKSYARRRGIQLVIQKNTILRIAAMHAGIQIPAKGHIRDDLSALLHGFYYFEKTGMRARDIQL